jgi:hypothetical protein
MARCANSRDLVPNDSRLIQLYAECDALFLPTAADLHSWVALEAMAMRLPVITTDVGAMPDGQMWAGPHIESNFNASVNVPRILSVMKAVVDDRLRLMIYRNFGLYIRQSTSFRSGKWPALFGISPESLKPRLR